MGLKKISFLLLAACLAFAGCDTQEIPDSTAVPVPLETNSSADTQESAAETILASMTLEERVWQMFMVTPEQLTGASCATIAGEMTESALAQYPVGGIIYFSQNLEDTEQTRALLSGTQAFAMADGDPGLFLAVDEEGGLVARCADKLGTTALEDMAVYGSRNDAAEAYEIGQTLGNDIGGLGFNVDFAPVADVDLCDGNELGDRIFSGDPQVVANMVSGVVKGLQDAGVSATLKHFPGLGAEDGNSHEDSHIRISRTLEELRQAEFVPFQAGIDAGADFVMVGHQIMSCAGDDLPSDLSPAVVTEYLRGELDFDGIAITDSHLMNTISEVYSPGEAAVLAIKAGMDMVLMPVDVQEAVESVCDAVENGAIPQDRIDESVTRILRKKEEMGLI